MNTEEIWTIGHSNKAFETFLDCLQSQRIELLADVRRFPGSRRYPHFGAEALAQSLRTAGIAYAHYPELGGHRPTQPDSPNDAWRNSAFRGYADYMMTRDFIDAIERLMETALKKRTAMMCAEALWWQCHRSLIADYLKARGWRVWHILTTTKIEEHPFSSAARIVDGQLTYASQDRLTGL